MSLPTLTLCRTCRDADPALSGQVAAALETPRMMCATQLASPATKAMFSRILTSGLFAGAAAGLITALLQLYFV